MKSFLKILGFILMPVLLIGLIYLISPKFRNWLSPFINKIKGLFIKKPEKQIEEVSFANQENIKK